MFTAREHLKRAHRFTGKTASGAPADGSTLATSGLLATLLPPEDRAKLREVNVRLTELAVEQCAAGGGAANQIDFGTQACTTLADFAAHGVSPAEVCALSRDHDVVFPWSLAYGNVRTPFNLRLTRLPLAIAFPRTVQEVAFWIDFVSCHGLSVSIRSGNNSYEGLSSSNEVILDLTFLTLTGKDVQFEVDAERNVVHTAPGVRLGVLYTELDKQGFALAGGQCAPVCVGGLVGTGGIGFSTRAAGWACDQLLEVECVLADGSVVVANADNEHADLYRACKGAGGAGLAVMTRLTMKLLPARPILWYSVDFNLESLLGDGGSLDLGAELLAAWQNLAQAPDGLSGVFVAIAGKAQGLGLLNVSGGFRVEHADRLEEAHRELVHDILCRRWLALLPSPFNNPLVIDLDEADPETVIANLSDADARRPLLTLQVVWPAQAATMAAELVPMPAFNQWKLKNSYTYRSLTAAEIAPVFDFLRRTAPSDDPSKAVGYVSAWLMGGMSARIDPQSAVVPVREGAVLWLHVGAQWNDVTLERPGLAWVEGLWKVLAPWNMSSVLYGCSDLDLGSQLGPRPNLGYVRDYWSSPTHDFVPFLVAVKNKYDPADLFQFAQSIPRAL